MKKSCLSLNIKEKMKKKAELYACTYAGCGSADSWPTIVGA